MKKTVWDAVIDLKGDLNNLDCSALIKQFNKKGVVLRGDYLRTINIWETQYPPTQIFYAFTEDIVQRPQELLCPQSLLYSHQTRILPDFSKRFRLGFVFFQMENNIRGELNGRIQN